MKEDPLVLIKQKELEQRQQVHSNPMTLKKIQKEIQMLKEGGSRHHHRKEKKKHKKHHRSSKKSTKKHHDKKKKHKRHHRSSSSDSSEARSRSSSFDSRDDNRRRRRRHRDRSSDSDEDYRRRKNHESSRRKKSDYYSRSALLKDHDPEVKATAAKQSHEGSSLGPNMSLYGERLKQINEMDRLRREKVDSGKRPKMTEGERESKLAEM